MRLTLRLPLVALVGAAVLPGSQIAAQSGPDVARAYREANEATLVRDFAELLSYPNRAHTPEIREAALYIRDQMRAVGVDTELLEIEGVSPLVLGVLSVPGATRTLGVYVHYDGQATDPTNWTHDPFEPTLYTAAMEADGEPLSLPAEGEAVDPEWRLYARSAGDDKAPIAAILPVLKSFMEAGVTPTSNVVFMFDGEERRDRATSARIWRWPRRRWTISTSGCSSTDRLIRVVGHRSPSAFGVRSGWK